MLIAKAYAQAVELSGDIPASAAIPDAPSATEAFMWNMGLVAILVFMFYILLIRPQQKRIREHTEMLQGLKKGDKVVTAGGLVGKISKIKDGEDEVQVDLGNNMTVTVVRQMLQGRDGPMLSSKAANDPAAKDEKKDQTKDKK